eukprot:scaffold45012_cov225-Isochrysis_galbana.AAC.1
MVTALGAPSRIRPAGLSTASISPKVKPVPASSVCVTRSSSSTSRNCFTSRSSLIQQPGRGQHGMGCRSWRGTDSRVSTPAVSMLKALP